MDPASDRPSSLNRSVARQRAASHQFEFVWVFTWTVNYWLWLARFVCWPVMVALFSINVATSESVVWTDVSNEVFAWITIVCLLGALVGNLMSVSYYHAESLGDDPWIREVVPLGSHLRARWLTRLWRLSWVFAPEHVRRGDPSRARPGPTTPGMVENLSLGIMLIGLIAAPLGLRALGQASILVWSVSAASALCQAILHPGWYNPTIVRVKNWKYYFRRFGYNIWAPLYCTGVFVISWVHSGEPNPAGWVAIAFTLFPFAYVAFVEAMLLTRLRFAEHDLREVESAYLTDLQELNLEHEEEVHDGVLQLAKIAAVDVIEFRELYAAELAEEDAAISRNDCSTAPLENALSLLQTLSDYALFAATYLYDSYRSPGISWWESFARHLQQQASQRNRQLAMEIDHEIADDPRRANMRLLRLCIMNLWSNSMRHGGAKIEIGVRCDRDGDGVRTYSITLSDDGSWSAEGPHSFGAQLADAGSSLARLDDILRANQGRLLPTVELRDGRPYVVALRGTFRPS